MEETDGGDGAFGYRILQLRAEPDLGQAEKRKVASRTSQLVSASEEAGRRLGGGLVEAGASESVCRAVLSEQAGGDGLLKRA